MKTIRACAGLACLIVVAMAVAADEAATVTVRSVHLCCGACVEGAKAALDGIEGVSEVKADVNSKSVVFNAKSEKAAQKGIEALADHGFFGKAAFGKKDLVFPDVGAKKGETDTGGLRIDQSGTYNFWCTVLGHRANGMQGTITVT